jgi:hypothetical protein
MFGVLGALVGSQFAVGFDAALLATVAIALLITVVLRGRERARIAEL